MSWVGQTLSGRYHIQELLGHGGMSSVYKATDPNLRRTVAIKIIHPHLSSDPDFLGRFEDEAAMIAQLRHENIIQVFDFNHEGDVYYMVLEYLPGETLSDRLKRLNEQNQKMDPAEVVKDIAEVGDAVQYAHDKGLIHRDIKPANIMLDVYGKAVLMDFGIARMIGGVQHTATGAVIGTAKYMSPEQIKGEKVDKRSDIY
jgi:serine/threonine-protein kinase